MKPENTRRLVIPEIPIRKFAQGTRLCARQEETLIVTYV